MKGRRTPTGPQEGLCPVQAYYVGKQYRRSYALLTDSKLVEADIRCRYLAARCLANLKEWDDCLNIMGGDPGYTDMARMQVPLLSNILAPCTFKLILALRASPPVCACCHDALTVKLSGLPSL